jgi:Tol biopolymer transport system component
MSDRGGDRGIWLIGAEGGAPQNLVPTADVVGFLTWFRDSQHLAYSRAGGDRPTISVVSLADRRSTPLPTPAGAANPSSSPTDDVIAYIEPLRPGSSRAAFINPQGQPLYPKLPMGPNLGVGALAWAADGRRLAAVSNNFVWIIDPNATQPFRKLADFPSAQRIRGVTWTRDGSAVIAGVEQATGDIVLFERE